MSIRVLVADDHEVVRSGLRALLEDSDLEVAGEAANRPEVVAQTEQLQPDVVLLDVRLGNDDGLAALEELRSVAPHVKVVMLTTYDNPTYVARAMALGASDYLRKGCTREVLMSTLRAAAAGEGPTSNSELRTVANAMATSDRTVEGDVTLTQREAQVVRHLGLGLSNKEIGRSLSISVETVKEHVQHVLRKINATDRTQAAVWAIRKGMV